jgi:hypothetical protein
MTLEDRFVGGAMVFIPLGVNRFNEFLEQSLSICSRTAIQKWENGNSDS